MHIWFLHKRFILDEVEPNVAWMIQEDLFNILWEDTTCRIRQAGVREMLVNKNLRQVQQYTFMHLTHYDQVYSELLRKPAERLQELRKLVWKHVFLKSPEYEHCHDLLDRFAWYIEANYQNIVLQWPDDAYRRAAVVWVNLPSFDDVRNAQGQHLPPAAVHPDDVLPTPWLTHITMTGEEYFWNPETGESTYERPKMPHRRMLSRVFLRPQQTAKKVLGM